MQADLDQIGVRAKRDVLARSPSFEERLKGSGMTIDRWDLPYSLGSYVIDGGFTASIKAGCFNWSLLEDASVDDLAKHAQGRPRSPRRSTVG